MSEEYPNRPKAPLLDWIPANEVDLLSGEQIRDRLRAEVRALETDSGLPASDRLAALVADVRAVLREGGPASEGLIVVASWLVGLCEAGVEQVPVRTLTALADAIEVGLISWRSLES